MKIIKIENCKECNHLVGQGIWEFDRYASTSTNSSSKYSGKDKYYCRLKKRKNYLGKFIGIAYENCVSIAIPSWCPLEDYKEADHETLI